MSKKVEESSSLEVLSIELDKHLSKAYMCILAIATYCTCKLASKDTVGFYLGFVDIKQDGRGKVASQERRKEHNGRDKVHQRMGLKPQRGTSSTCELHVKWD